ncbi:nuclease-related domain-containing protein [Pseudomonas aeruginosa]|uniref:nuclease-related domain-containing protein n=1 Tax=Pseudomonas aeruginosa TaxID=287 RepID=UPI0029BFCA63|nr:NERD domain-containing protein [Pseudomonas aeruginosa]
MDFSLALAHVWSTLVWLIPVVLLIGMLKTPWAKGQIGELLVRLLAHWQLDKTVYRRLHNLTLDTPDGTTQIDHVFLSPYGIFVLETKNMTGWIFGSEMQALWTQKVFKQTYRFQNPLRQNYKHLKALEACLGVKPENLHSVISFVGGSTFKTEMPVCVTQGNGFVRYIKSFQQIVFSKDEIEVMFQTLQTDRRANSLATHREHVQNLKLRGSDPTAERQCPKCGNSLIVRTVKTGPKAGQQFWGCSEFPRCRVMQSL